MAGSRVSRRQSFFCEALLKKEYEGVVVAT